MKHELQVSSPDADKKDREPSTEEAQDILEVNETSTAEEERRVVRKIDMTVLPLMCFVFFLQYLDKQSLSYAAVSKGPRAAILPRPLTSLGLWSHH